MFSGAHGLGESQMVVPEEEWYDDSGDMLNTTDTDMIALNFYSPGSGYPPQRISNYDVPLAEHQTLNGVGLGKLPTRQKFGNFFGVMARTRSGSPVRSTSFIPRYSGTARHMRYMGPVGRTRRG